MTPIDSKISQEIVIPPGAERPADAAAGSNDPAQKAQGSQRKTNAVSVDRVLGEEAARSVNWDDLEGVVVDVEITDWPAPTKRARGRVVEVLGHENDFGVDVEITIRKFHLPHHFPAATLEEAQNIAAVIPAREMPRRRDFRSLPIVTIDGETARDFDDAVTVRKSPNGNFSCRFILRMWRSMSRLARRSTRKRGFGGPAFTFQTVRFRCCRWSCRLISAAFVRTWTDWCCLV